MGIWMGHALGMISPTMRWKGCAFRQDGALLGYVMLGDEARLSCTEGHPNIPPGLEMDAHEQPVKHANE